MLPQATGYTWVSPHVDCLLRIMGGQDAQAGADPPLLTHCVLPLLLQLLLERCLSASGITAVIKPAEALAVTEYVVACLWAHDRLRDAFCWRALLVRGHAMLVQCAAS